MRSTGQDTNKQKEAFVATKLPRSPGCATTPSKRAPEGLALLGGCFSVFFFFVEEAGLFGALPPWRLGCGFGFALLAVFAVGGCFCFFATDFLGAFFPPFPFCTSLARALLVLNVCR